MTHIDFDSTVPTEAHPTGRAFYWLFVRLGIQEGYTSFNVRPTPRQIRQFKKSLTRG